MITAFSILAVLAMVGCLFLIPLGLPGLWGMVIVAGIGALFGLVAPMTLVGLGVIAGFAELLEFLAVKKMGDRFGGSSKAFWGAVLGGLIGAVVGTPIPLIGSVVGAFVGTFLGAGAVTVLEGRSVVEAGAVGWGAFIGRSLAVALKGAAGVLILTVTTLALFF